MESISSNGTKTSLFNLDEDVGEKKNLVRAEPKMVKTLEDELAAWEKDVLAGVKLRR
jgi:hypothetical protein